jgi:hypothetical protein
MISRIGHHYQPTLWDALWVCVCPYKLILLTSPFWAKVCPIPNVGVQFWFGLMQESSICPCHMTTPFVHSLCSWRNLLNIFGFYFTYNLMSHICVVPCPTKRKVMSSSHPMFLLPLFQSIVEFFYGFLRMFHIWFIHPRCLYRMVFFPLDQVFSLSPPSLLWFKHNLHFKFWFIMSEIRWRP